MTDNTSTTSDSQQELDAGLWQDIRQFFPSDESVVGMLSTLAGDSEMRSARFFTDAYGIPHFRDRGNVMLSINDIERGEELIVVASTFNEKLSDPKADGLSGAVFTKMAWVFDGGRSAPVTINILREFLDDQAGTSEIAGSSYVQGWVLTGEPGGR
jgi:hypothetical protein